MPITMAADDPDIVLPPPGPPSILTFYQARHLSYHGWLSVDLPTELKSQLERLSAAAATFFDQDHEEKRSQYPQSHGTECGFYEIPEEKEYLTLRYQTHPETSLEQLARDAWRGAAQFLYRILCDLGRAGYYEPTVWDSMVEDTFDIPSNDAELETNTTLLRLFRYYPTIGFASEHIDIGLLTLCVGDGPGLQVWNGTRPSRWVDAEGPTVVIGDMLRTLLDHKVRAGLHRVVGNPNGRASTVFALRPNAKGEIDLANFGGQGVVRTKDYFDVVKGAKHNINASRDIRDDQLRIQRERKERMQERLRPTSTFGSGLIDYI